jgi:hypothetical protein
MGEEMIFCCKYSIYACHCCIKDFIYVFSNKLICYKVCNDT